ncbi:uncharacterized protein LOC120081398 isoform X1 [Benincasa hispida]|uniref:uncharacterized protein LOC120081398 isoform X1 n=1 Tax=Benincasa hispida TaxID=102211 RepID=UPI001902719C|nr:uncharacterized protein LOC120081398 isoform X1 [Benincasa hispida]
MQGDEARILLGFSPGSRPSSSQVKEAYKRKVWDTHPDLFPPHEKPHAESKFKLCRGVANYKGSEWSALDVRGCWKAIEPIKAPGVWISEAYSCLLTGARNGDSHSATYERVVKRGVPVSHGGRRNHALIKLPFLLLILGTVSLGGFNVSRAYKKQKEMYPSHNPFLP